MSQHYVLTNVDALLTTFITLPCIKCFSKYVVITFAYETRGEDGANAPPSPKPKPSTKTN